MAKGYYMELESKENKRKEIEDNITELDWLIESSDWDIINVRLSKVCEKWLDKVFMKLLNQQYELAKHEFYSMYEKEKSFQNTDSAILEFMFTIHEREIENGEGDNIFELFTSFEQMKDIYFELKYLLRRFEYDLPQKLKDELFDFLQQYPISAIAICEMINRYIKKQEKVLNEVAMFLFFKQCYEQVLPLLFAAYEKNQNNSETLYNMAYVLYAFGEKETALNFMRRIKKQVAGDLQLQQAIMEGTELPLWTSHYVEENQELPKLEKPERPEKIAFILCVNDERQYKECCFYIQRLMVPEGYSVEIVPIYHAKSMASGYQEGMKKTDAKYKIYIHQDVLCTNKYLIYDMIYIFNLNPDIGLVGAAGCVKMPLVGVWWKAPVEERYYNLYQDVIITCANNCGTYYNCGEYQEVQVLDGVFLATSKDIDWREDLFDNWHYYDIAQSFEFQRQGYKAVIPKPRMPWVLHNDKWGRILENDYFQATKRFLQEYKEDLI